VEGTDKTRPVRDHQVEGTDKTQPVRGNRVEGAGPDEAERKGPTREGRSKRAKLRVRSERTHQRWVDDKADQRWPSRVIRPEKADHIRPTGRRRSDEAERKEVT